MSYGISANGYHSEDDFGWALANREETPPKLRRTTVSVPYSNGVLDYTGVYGEEFYEEKTIAFEFTKDFDGITEALEGVREFTEWLLGIVNDDVHDDMFAEFHHHGSCTDVKPEHEKSGAKAKVTATFELDPFMKADDESADTLIVGTNYVINEGRPVRLTAKSSGSWSSIEINDETETVTGTEKVTSLRLESGLNVIEVDGSACTIRWIEERL